MGWTLSTMAWGIIDGKEMLQKQSFDGSSNLKWAIGTLEYGLSFLLDCSYDDGEFVAQVRRPRRKEYFQCMTRQVNYTLCAVQLLC